MPFILRSKNRPGFASYEPESISAWSDGEPGGPKAPEQPDLSMAPAEAWEEVADAQALEAAYAAAPAFAPAAADEPT